MASQAKGWLYKDATEKLPYDAQMHTFDDTCSWGSFWEMGVSGSDSCVDNTLSGLYDKNARASIDVKGKE